MKDIDPQFDIYDKITKHMKELKNSSNSNNDRIKNITAILEHIDNLIEFKRKLIKLRYINNNDIHTISKM